MHSQRTLDPNPRPQTLGRRRGRDGPHQVEFAGEPTFLECARHRRPHLPQVLLCIPPEETQVAYCPAPHPIAFTFTPLPTPPSSTALYTTKEQRVAHCLATHAIAFHTFTATQCNRPLAARSQGCSANLTKVVDDGLVMSKWHRDVF